MSLVPYPLDLVVAVDGAKGSFRKAFLRKGPAANAPNDFFATVAEGGIVRQNGQDQARDMGPRHFGQLLAKRLFRPIS